VPVPRRRQHPSQRFRRRVETAVEQDQNQRGGADPECELVVIERDTADALAAREHADDEEDEYDGNSRTLEPFREKDARDDERGESRKEDGAGERLGMHEPKGAR